MNNYKQPTLDFLSIVLELIKTLDDDTASILFIKLCAIRKNEELVIEEHMVSRAIHFLINE